MRPTSQTPLPPPVNIDPLEDVPAGLVQHYRASEAGRLYAATMQDLNPRTQAMLERVCTRERERISFMRQVKRRISVKSRPSGCPGYDEPVGGDSQLPWVGAVGPGYRRP